MSLESRYSLSMTEKSIRQGHYGIPVETLGQAYRDRAQELERKEIPWLDAYTGVQGGTNGTNRPEMWTEGDSFLRIKLGTKVKYNESKVYPSDKNLIEKTVGRYSSPLVQSKLRDYKKAVLSEQFLMGDVDYVEDSLDLRKTEIASLSKLKSVGANLTLDTNSILKSMPELKRVDGKVTVIAKNRDEMNQYLQKLGIVNDKNEPQIKIGKGIEFIMRSYI